ARRTNGRAAPRRRDQRRHVDLREECVSFRVACRNEDAVRIRTLGELRPVDAEHRTYVEEDGRPEAQFARARSERDFELRTAEVVRRAAERVVLVAAIVERKKLGLSILVGRPEPPHHARTDTEDVKTAHFGRAEEESIGQLDAAEPRPAVLETLDITGFAAQRENPARAQ